MRNWKKIEGFDFKEIIFEEYNHIAKITIKRSPMLVSILLLPVLSNREDFG